MRAAERQSHMGSMKVSVTPNTKYVVSSLQLHSVSASTRYEPRRKKHTKCIFGLVSQNVVYSRAIQLVWRNLSNKMNVKQSQKWVSAAALCHVPPCVCVFSQDFSVDFGHCPEITVYTGCCLFPAAEQLPTLWAENKKALLSMLVEVRCKILILKNIILHTLIN